MPSPQTSSDDAPRQSPRYDFAIPIVIELSNGLFKTSDRVIAYLVDLSAGGAALISEGDPRLKSKGRYRVFVNDHSGVIQVRNISHLADGQVRLGVSFTRLGLELQELVVDSLATARSQATRLT